MIRLFVSYAHADESLFRELEKHLTSLKHQGLVEVWNDRLIDAGDDWARAIDANLAAADVILLLISSDFIASRYCFQLEAAEAMRRHAAGEAVVIPIILRPCDWHSLPFGKLQAATTDGRPVVKFQALDDGFLEVVQAIKTAATRMATNESPPTTPTADPLLLALLSFFWRYPSGGGNRVSWAVKESFVFRGKLDRAREDPGLGAAIITTEFALDVFGNEAQPAINGVVAWALSRCATEPPYLLLAEFFDTRTSEIVKRPDFRHTLAFAVVLARTRRLDSHLREYLKLTLETQNPDGGWHPGEGATVSEAFTVLYAVEFLTLCGSDESLSREIRQCCLDRRSRAISWLVSAAEGSGMWQSGVINEFVWDDVVTTAWMLHRLAGIKDVSIPDWSRCVDRAASAMTLKAVQEQTWKGTPELQRFYVEARVAAAIAKLLSTDSVASDPPGLREIYLSKWRQQVFRLAPDVADERWDVATAAFVLEALFSTKQLRDGAVAAGLIAASSRH